MSKDKYESKRIDLENKEPWTKKELKRIPKYEREFIRDIQISRQLSKKAAMNWYLNSYVPKSKEQRRKLRTIIIDKVESLYPKHKRKGTRIRGEHKLPKGKGRVKRKKFSSQFENFEDWNEYQIINNKAKGKYYERIVKAYNKQPNKNLNELRGHGERKRG